jgi:DNA-binding CsgD family transcriptional regulator/PAS domain-containing protein
MTLARPHGEPRANLEPLLYRIHASGDANGDWSDVLELLRDRLAGRLATLSRHNFESGQGAIICESPENPRFRTAYAQYASRNPWFLSSEEFTPGRVVTGDELLSNRDLVKTDFYRGLLEPHGLFHCLSGVAARRGQLIYYVSVHRGQDEAAYGEREKGGLRAVLAHLSLALEHRWRLRQSGDLTKVMMGVVDRHPHPSLLVDADGRIVHCNRSATALSVPRAGLCIEGGRLAAATPIDRAALREAIRDVAKAAASDAADATRAVTLSVPGARHPVVVSVHAAGRVFRVETGDIDELVLVTARNPQIEHDIHTCSFVKQFRLSPAQARVSVLIVTGHSLADTAQKLHVSENTARSHLKQVFQKTNTHGQMELVHLHARNCVDSE